MPRLNRTLALAAALAFLCSAVDAQTAPNENETHIVRLQDNGSLVGYTAVNWVSGKSEAVAASIELTQDGAPIATAQSDDEGNFKIADLSPGDYHAFVSIEKGTAEFDVQLVDTQHGSYVGDHLTATLTPLPDGCGCQVAVNDSAFWTPSPDFVDQNYVDGPVDYQMGPQMGPGCGDDCGMVASDCGGGFCGDACAPACGCGGCVGIPWGLAGLGGLAGLAGLSNDGGKNITIVSPSEPVYIIHGDGHEHDDGYGHTHGNVD